MTIIDKLIDLVFPRRCPVCHDIVRERGGLICSGCSGKLTYIHEPYCIKCGKPFKDPDRVVCKGCESIDNSFKEGRAVFVYDDAMKQSIYRFKYGGRREYAKFYATQIYIKYKSKINIWNPQVIIPIPVHKSKLKKRGYNQAYLIAKELSLLLKIPIDNNLLKRTKRTEIQKNLSADERRYNLKNAFKISTNRVQYLSAMLIDDIYTTGATMNSASLALKESGITEIYCISLSAGLDV